MISGECEEPEGADVRLFRSVVPVAVQTRRVPILLSLKMKCWSSGHLSRANLFSVNVAVLAVAEDSDQTIEQKPDASFGRRIALSPSPQLLTGTRPVGRHRDPLTLGSAWRLTN